MLIGAGGLAWPVAVWSKLINTVGDKITGLNARALYCIGIAITVLIATTLGLPVGSLYRHWGHLRHWLPA